MMPASAADTSADPTVASPVGETKQERRHLAAIERRIRWLEQLVLEPGRRSTSIDWDRAEIAALRWALSRIADAERSSS